MTDLKPAPHQKLQEARATMLSKVAGLGEHDLRRDSLARIQAAADSFVDC